MSHKIRFLCTRSGCWASGKCSREIHDGGPTVYNILRRAGVALAAAAACTAMLSVPAAHAATTTASPAVKLTNWAGYYAATGGKTVDGVSAVWKVPSVSCKKSGGGFPSVGGLWVGTGGLAGSWAAGSNSLLEQDGIQVKCAAKNSQPTMTPFWQIAGIQGNSQPFKSIYNVSPVVHAGDVIDAWVAAPDGSPKPGEWYFQVIDETTSATWQAYYTMPASDYKKTFKSVEVITEWAESYRCPKGETTCLKKDATRDGFVYFGPVTYSNADWETSGEDWFSVAQGKISLWSANYKVERVYPTSPSSADDSDVANDAFSTEYQSGWTGDF
jgi:Peptidase A4 family